MVTGACAGKYLKKKPAESRLKNTTGFVLVTFLLMFFSKATLEGATREELQNEINKLNVKVSELQSKSSALSQDQSKLIGRFKMTNASKSALLVVGVSTATRNQDVQIPISFIPGPDPISGLQQDIVWPSSFTVVSLVAGPAATAAGKLVQTNTVDGIVRMLVFGLNQTAIGEGVIAVVTLRANSIAPNGTHPITTCNPSASDGNGMPVSMSLTSGWVKL